MNFENMELQFKEHFVKKPPKQQTDPEFKATSNRNEGSALPKDETGRYQRTSPILKRRVVSPPKPAEPKQNQNPTRLNTGFTSYTDASEMDFNVDSLTDFFIEEDAERLWKGKKYNEALPFLQHCLVSSSKYDRNILQLKVALCMRETDRGGESTKLISQTLEDLRQNPPPPTRCQTVAEQMRKVGETYTEQSASSRALWIFKSASDIFKLGSDPDNAVI
uniref:Uncharacterized protein n=1 Tax=Ciona savignyi TaxID=51511 RepID=H2YVJ5_CIOSA